jgi:two-component system LytT family sensor kinase
MRVALHAATATLPHLRRGLTRDSAQKSIGHLQALTQARGVAVADREHVLAAAGAAPRVGEPLPAWVDARRDDRVQVQPCLPGMDGSAVAAPLMVQGGRVGTLIAAYGPDLRVRPEDARVVSEVASLVSAQVELSAVAAQGERLARAELRALRAQISPHFIYNALAAVASYIHTRPEEARELLTEFAEFTRYAFRGKASYVTLADELHYVEKYLRLERARFGERLEVRVSVAPEVLGAVVPVLSLQPLVENAVRHGVESAPGRCRVEILGADLDADVELAVRDDGTGMESARAESALQGQAGGIGLSNVHARLQASFGEAYGLTVESRPGAGTTVRMLVPKFHAGVRAA